MAKTAANVSKRFNRTTTIELKDSGPERPLEVPQVFEPIKPGAVIQPPAVATANAPAAPVPLEDLVARVAPAVVSIQSSDGRGTGFFVQPDTILTNAHVAGSDVTLRIRRNTGQEFNARVERVAADIDLAVLKISQPLDDQTVLPLGEISRVRSGEDVIAIGSALGVLQNSVTRGIVSAVRRTETLMLIQTDAAINPGNSGGPLIDRTGTVIGINTLTNRAAQGISFAVAVDHARELVAGRHLVTTTSTPLSTVRDASSGSSESDRTRAEATQRYDRALAQLSRRADNLDQDWQRFRRDCYRGPTNSSFSHGWFSVFDGKAIENFMVSGCGSFLADIKSEAHTIENTVVAMDEQARKENILPGTRRELRQKYHLDYAGWDR